MPSDLLMFVGKEHYPWPNDFSDEAFRVGVSKRVSRNSIPEIEPGVTRLALIHPKAIVKVTAEGMDLYDLAWELVGEHQEGYGMERVGEMEIDEYISRYLVAEGNKSMSGLTWLLREIEATKDLKRLEEKYGIEYQAGVFGFCFLSAVHYCLRSDEHDLPADLEAVRGIKIVRMDYGEDAP